MRTSMLFGLGFFVQFLIGGLSGIFIASPVLDYQASASYVIVAHFHYTLFAGSIFGFFAGVFHWFPKVTGRLLRERLGQAAAGSPCSSARTSRSGRCSSSAARGCPRRISRYPTHPGGGTLNLLETIGAGIYRARRPHLHRQPGPLARPSAGGRR